MYYSLKQKKILERKKKKVKSYFFLHEKKKYQLYRVGHIYERSDKGHRHK